MACTTDSTGSTHSGDSQSNFSRSALIPVSHRGEIPCIKSFDKLQENFLEKKKLQKTITWGVSPEIPDMKWVLQPISAFYSIEEIVQMACTK